MPPRGSQVTCSWSREPFKATAWPQQKSSGEIKVKCRKKRRTATASLDNERHFSGHMCIDFIRQHAKASRSLGTWKRGAVLTAVAAAVVAIFTKQMWVELDDDCAISRPLTQILSFFSASNYAEGHPNRVGQLLTHSVSLSLPTLAYQLVTLVPLALEDCSTWYKYEREEEDW